MSDLKLLIGGSAVLFCICLAMPYLVKLAAPSPETVANRAANAKRNAEQQQQQQREQAAKRQATGVQVAAEMIVEGGLKSPATAKFGPMKVQPFNDNEWLVTGYVDSQNGFGAIVRAEFLVAVVHKNGQWSGSIVAFDQR